MSAMRTKLIVAGFLLAGAVSYLAFAGIRSGWVYFLDVDQYQADPASHVNQRLRLHGRVLADGLEVNRASLTAHFAMVGRTPQQQEHKPLSVVYRGVIPEMFAAERDVVVEGRVDNTGVLQADLLMTKCASKYQSDSPHKTNTGGDGNVSAKAE